MNKNELTRYTNARVAIGHSGGHMRTHTWLRFQLDLAIAKDAICKEIDLSALAHIIHQLDSSPKTHIARSCAKSLEAFLTRPDLGRSLDHESERELSEYIHRHPECCDQDILIVISTGLSPLAIEDQVVLLLEQLLPLIQQCHWSIAPIILSEHTRVAFADKVNEIFKAKMLINLIGERPGLSSGDSMGIYFTYHSSLYSSDDQRNCISNIHDHGLHHADAVKKLVYLIDKAFTLGASGVALKDDFTPELLSQVVRRLSYQ